MVGRFTTPTATRDKRTAKVKKQKAKVGAETVALSAPTFAFFPSCLKLFRAPATCRWGEQVGEFTQGFEVIVGHLELGLSQAGRDFF